VENDYSLNEESVISAGFSLVASLESTILRLCVKIVSGVNFLIAINSLTH